MRAKRENKDASGTTPRRGRWRGLSAAVAEATLSVAVAINKILKFMNITFYVIEYLV